MTQIDPSTSTFMDASRWIAALAVVLAHTTAIMMVDEAYAHDPSPLLQFMFAMKSVGYLGVIIFFVMSGYLVGGRELLRVRAAGRFEPARYAIQRVSRIYTVLIPALLLTLALDHAGQLLFNQTGLYTSAQSGVGSVNYVIADRDDIATLLGNLLLLQTIAAEPLGGDGPLWSLANEWWYYVAFGLFLIATSARERVRWRIASVIGLLLVVAMMPWTMLLLASLWLIGVAAAVIGQRWRGLPPVPAMLLLAAGLVGAVWGMSGTSALDALPRKLAEVMRLFIDFIPALTFAVALISAKNLPGPRAAQFHQRLASFSFSLYAIHFPVLLFLAGAAHEMFGLALGRPFDLACAATILVTAAVICTLAWGFSLVTERHTKAVRTALTALLHRLQRRAVSRPLSWS